MGPLGTQELFFIFVLALLLFGPKKLPELGKTIGKAMTEFRRAQSELKATLSREMDNLERETGVRELAATTTSYVADSYNFESYEEPFNGDDSDVYATTYEASASAIQGAEFEAAPLQIEAAAESVPQGQVHDAGHVEGGQFETGHAQATEPANAPVHS